MKNLIIIATLKEYSKLSKETIDNADVIILTDNKDTNLLIKDGDNNTPIILINKLVMTIVDCMIDYKKSRFN